MSLLLRALRKTSSRAAGANEYSPVGKHKRLNEDWSCATEPVVEGVPFFVKYLGSSLVQRASGEQETADAIKSIVAMARNKKLAHVKLTISLGGIHMVDMATRETTLAVSIYRISYCSADATYDRVFAFIATNSNKTFECHAFLCPKRKMAQCATLTIAQAFNLAFELWEASHERRRRRRRTDVVAKCCQTRASPEVVCGGSVATATAVSRRHFVQTAGSSGSATVSSSSSASSGYQSGCDGAHCLPPASCPSAHHVCCCSFCPTRTSAASLASTASVSAATTASSGLPGDGAQLARGNWVVFESELDPSFMSSSPLHLSQLNTPAPSPMPLRAASTAPARWRSSQPCLGATGADQEVGTVGSAGSTEGTASADPSPALVRRRRRTPGANVGTEELTRDLQLSLVITEPH